MQWCSSLCGIRVAEFGTRIYKWCTGVCNVVLCGVHPFRFQWRSIAHSVVSLSRVGRESGKTERPLRLIYPQTPLAGVRTTDQQPRGSCYNLTHHLHALPPLELPASVPHVKCLIALGCTCSISRSFFFNHKLFPVIRMPDSLYTFCRFHAFWSHCSFLLRLRPIDHSWIIPHHQVCIRGIMIQLLNY